MRGPYEFERGKQLGVTFLQRATIVWSLVGANSCWSQKHSPVPTIRSSTANEMKEEHSVRPSTASPASVGSTTSNNPTTASCERLLAAFARVKASSRYGTLQTQIGCTIEAATNSTANLTIFCDPTIPMNMSTSLQRLLQTGATALPIGAAAARYRQGGLEHVVAWDDNSDCKIDVSVRGVDPTPYAKAILDALP